MKHDWQQKLPEEQREVLEAAAQPTWVDPMLATLTDDYFSDPAWLFERKLDGERCMVYRKEGKVKLGSRNHKDISDRYPELIQALESIDAPDLISDGEIVAFDGKVTSFSRLQNRIHHSDPGPELLDSTPVYLYLFDLISLDGYDLTQLPLRTRKDLLWEVIEFEDPLRYTPHRNEEGEAFRKEACQKGWEGIIAKKADATYVHSRSKKWLKFKCVARQELVVAGYTDPQGERIGFGAILVGYYEGDQLRYAGKVGTGYSDDQLEKLHARFEKLEQDECPFQSAPEVKDVHWLQPKLVAEIGFTEWTPHDKLRHPRFLGLRDDKSAREVHREQPV